MAVLENKFQKLNRLAFEQMPEIIKSTKEGLYVFTPESVYSILVKKGFAEVNCDIKNDAGECATRATQEGIEKFQTGEEEIMSEVESVGGIEIENVAVVAKRASRSGKGSIYPFAALEIGQSFFVAATEDKPEPWKKMASTVGTAMTRFAVPVLDTNGQPVMRLVAKGPNKGASVPEMKKTRVFTMIKDEKNGVAGARIGRTA